MTIDPQLTALYQKCCNAFGGHMHDCFFNPEATVLEFPRLEPLLWEGDQA